VSEALKENYLLDLVAQNEGENNKEKEATVNTRV
jgi:hypothetical protein